LQKVLCKNLQFFYLWNQINFLRLYSSQKNTQSKVFFCWLKSRTKIQAFHSNPLFVKIWHTRWMDQVFVFDRGAALCWHVRVTWPHTKSPNQREKINKESRRTRLKKYGAKSNAQQLCVLKVTRKSQCTLVGQILQK
jgi:hypothetical protein